METEGEIFEGLKKPERTLADNYKYTNYLFKVKIKEIMDGYELRKMGEKETLAWVQKIISIYG